MKRWLHRHLIAKLGATAIRLLGGTIRLRVHDPHSFLAQHKRPSVLFVFWHDELFLLPYFQSRLMAHRRLAAMISRSRDGAVISNIIRDFGMLTARGSSSQRGSAALLGLRHWLREDIDAAITPDGPRGPRHILQPGVLGLARLTGCTIIPLRLEYSHKIELHSWDRFQIPLPFSRCDLHFKAPITLSPDATDSDLQEATHSLSAALGG